MLATLVLHICLAASPTICRDETPPALAPINFVACEIKGEEAAQEWLGDHPKWALKGWGCQVGKRAEPT